MSIDNLTYIRKSFKEYFDVPGFELPVNIEIGVVRSFEYVGTGWDINYKLGKEGDQFFLDFYACHRMTNSRHNRILENGDVISLENFWEFGFPVYKDDPEREKKEREEIYSKNQQVEEILRSKGLL
jgi:hypothetical protein